MKVFKADGNQISINDLKVGDKIKGVEGFEKTPSICEVKSIDFYGYGHTYNNYTESHLYE